MRNRAKCKLCNSIIESFHHMDYVLCKCEEIFVDGGSALKCGAKSWENFLRIDDKDNIIVPRVIEKDEIIMDEKTEEPKEPLSKKYLLDRLNEMIKSYENLPQSALTLPINHYDFISLMLLIQAFLECKD